MIDINYQIGLAEQSLRVSQNGVLIGFTQASKSNAISIVFNLC